MTAQLTDVDNADIYIGMQVEMVTRKLREDGPRGMLVYGYKFRPPLRQPRSGGSGSRSSVGHAENEKEDETPPAADSRRRLCLSVLLIIALRAHYSYDKLSRTLIWVARRAGVKLASNDSTTTIASHSHTPWIE